MQQVFYAHKSCKIICQRGNSTVPMAGSNGAAASPLWVSCSLGSNHPLSKECFLDGCAFIIAKRESDGLIQWFLEFVLRHSVHHSCLHPTGQTFSQSSQCVPQSLGTRVSNGNENILPNSK